MTRGEGNQVAVTWRGQVVLGELSTLGGKEKVSWREPNGKRRYLFLETRGTHGWHHL